MYNFTCVYLFFFSYFESITDAIESGETSLRGRLFVPCTAGVLSSNGRFLLAGGLGVGATDVAFIFSPHASSVPPKFTR